MRMRTGFVVPWSLPPSSPQLSAEGKPSDLIPLRPSPTLSFSTAPLPAMGLIFASPRSPPPLLQASSSSSQLSRKRRRAVADVDGDNSCMAKKKRRLRKTLCTSRLSPWFSYPATNIVERGTAVAAAAAAAAVAAVPTAAATAAWKRARSKALLSSSSSTQHDTPTALRKTAILNHIRQNGGHFVAVGRDALSPRVPQHPHTRPRAPSPTPPAPLPLAPPPHNTPHTPSSTQSSIQPTRSPNLAYTYALPLPLPLSVQLPRKNYTPPPPSPLGLSNYEALDGEDAVLGPYSHLGDDGGYSDGGKEGEGLAWRWGWCGNDGNGDAGLGREVLFSELDNPGPGD